VDGGAFIDGEGVRLVMMAKGLTHARSDHSANFAFVDLESDFRVPAIEEACRVFGTRIIRSFHSPHGMPEDLDLAWADISAEPDEIPELAVTCRDADDLARLVAWSKGLPERERIIIGMGPQGFPSRVLGEQFGSTISFTSAIAAGMPGAAPGQIDPGVLSSIYHVGSINRTTAVYALAGGPATIGSRSPELHNAAFAQAGLDAVFLPVPAIDVGAFMAAAEAAGVVGASVTVPHKESIIPFLAEISVGAAAIGACNTILRGPKGWQGYNTDTIGFERALRDFLGSEEFSGLRATIVGAGGAARAVAAVLSGLGVEGLVINRTVSKARTLARGFGFAWASCDEHSMDLVSSHSDLIINATSKGMEGGDSGDPLDWYEFTGRESVYDLIYRPDRSDFLRRAFAAGCRVSNGLGMLRYQAAEQFRIWTGREPPSVYFE
jgi:3-dehydroquinate dehydratase/shikimate dehydrogenase